MHQIKIRFYRNQLENSANMFCTHIDLDNLEYKPPAANRSGGKVVHVSTVKGSADWKDRIRFQMSEDNRQNLQQAVWGLSTPLPGMDASRRTLELTVESPALHTFLENLDAKNVDTAISQAPEWFRKSVDADAIKNMYVPLVKPPQKADMKHTVRVKVKCGDYPTNIYVVDSTDDDGNLTYVKGTPEDLTRNAKCMVMAESVGLWFMSRQFGMSLSATDIVVWPNRRNTGINAFTMAADTKLKNTTVALPPAALGGADVDMCDDMPF